MSETITSSTGSTADSGSTGTTPSVSSGSSPVASDSRPASFQEAFQAVGASDTPDPGDVTPDPSAPAPATVEPVSAAAEPELDAQNGPPAKGPIPFDRHEAILANARDKTAREIVSQVQQRYGGGIQLQNAMQADPVGTLTQLIDEAVDHPELGQQVISALARKLGARRSTGPDLNPIDTEIGKVYTAEQMDAIVEQKLAQRLAPIERDRETAQQERARQQFREQTAQTVKSRLSQWESQPGFSDHKSEIASKQAELVKMGPLRCPPWYGAAGARWGG